MTYGTDSPAGAALQRRKARRHLEAARASCLKLAAWHKRNGERSKQVCWAKRGNALDTMLKCRGLGGRPGRRK